MQQTIFRCTFQRSYCILETSLLTFSLLLLWHDPLITWHRFKLTQAQSFEGFKLFRCLSNDVGEKNRFEQKCCCKEQQNGQSFVNIISGYHTGNYRVLQHQTTIWPWTVKRHNTLAISSPPIFSVVTGPWSRYGNARIKKCYLLD